MNPWNEVSSIAEFDLGRGRRSPRWDQTRKSPSGDRACPYLRFQRVTRREQAAVAALAAAFRTFMVTIPSIGVHLPGVSSAKGQECCPCFLMTDTGLLRKDGIGTVVGQFEFPLFARKTNM